MKNKYLFLGAASALMLAACSEDIKGPDALRPSEDGLNLTSLSPASQAGRVSLPGQTRGQKADRLQLVAKIAPVAESQAATHNWSATGIAIANGTAYVSWHSDHQAKTPADSWGGALDAISINALVSGQGDVITSTQTSSRVKFNNVVAAGTNLYFPLTCYNNGAVIGRLAPGAEVMDTIGIPGSSANAIEVVGTTLYAVTGYAGGAYSMPVSFNEDSEFVEIAPMTNKFGGKYIVGGKILRTDDTKAYILPIDGSAETELDVPLTSSLKYAEAYDPANGEWYELSGDQAAYYGKHTMAIDGNYTYVGAGKNGLRVYAATGLVWNNNTNTTAVCVATVDGEKYIFAATGAGLRVYEPYNSEKDSLPLYAFEVKDYDDNGMAQDAPNANTPEAGTTAHSSNFVAVDSESGLIFVACGQSGVYVFKLDTTVPVEKIKVSLSIPAINHTETGEIEGEDETSFTIPLDEPTKEGEDFIGWSTDPDAIEPEYHPGDEVTVTPENPNVVLYPIFRTHVYAFILHFNGNKEGVTVSNLPGDITSDDAEVTVPNVTPTVPEGTLNPAFIGWATDPEMTVAHRDAGFWTPIMPGNSFTCTAAETTLYAIWATNATAGGTQSGGEVPNEDDNNEGGSGTGSGSDSGSGNLH